MLNKRIFVLVSLLLILSLLVGCGTTPPIVDNHAPNITSTAVTDAEVGILYIYDVEATDLDGDTITYFLTRNPSGMEIDEDTGLITWTPNSAGNFGVTVEVSDGVLSDTQPFTITITPVAELTEIVVTPDTMDLEVGGTGTFTVTAHYSFGDPQDVTDTCVYTLTQPDAGVITVEAPLVTAVGVGTDTIFISYTEDSITKTATIAVTVRIPMEITVDLPTFKVGEPAWFTVEMIANDDLGKLVVASFGWPISDTDVKIAGVLETDVGSDVNFALEEGDVFQTDPFNMEDTTTVNFRGTFDEPGTYGTTIEVKTSPDGVLLCSLPITIIVEALVVGDSYGGGIVAYILQSGDSGYDPDIQHGLIAATVDQSTGIAWSNITDVEIGTSAQGTAIGTGQTNTTAIIGQVGHSASAALVCDDYVITVDEVTYNDWFLPSKDELGLMYTNLYLNGVAGLYWSSSEADATKAWKQDFGNGWQSDISKGNLYRVRAVRVF